MDSIGSFSNEAEVIWFNDKFIERIWFSLMQTITILLSIKVSIWLFYRDWQLVFSLNYMTLKMLKIKIMQLSH